MYSDLYPCSPEHGCLKIVWKLDQDTIDEDFECPIFDLEINEGKTFFEIFHFGLY